MAMRYKKGRVYIRMIDKDLFIWDAVYKGEIYSHHITIPLLKGKKKLTQDQVKGAIDICYAGAATTIDMKMGVKLDKKTKDTVKRFEESRKQFEKAEKGL